MRTVTYSMAVSLDGYVAGPDGQFDWGIPDEELARFVLAVRRWRDEGRCVVLVEHNHELINAVCDRTMVLAAGKVLGVGDLEELRRGEHIREIIGDRLD